MPNRRDFLQWTTAGAAALAAGSGFATPSRCEAGLTKEPSAAEQKRKYALGIASYTVTQFPLEKGIEMTVAVGLKHFCLHPRFVPIDKPDEVVKAAEAVRAAGLDLYACGVIYMKTAAEVDQAFEYAKAAGVKLIVGVPMPELLAMTNEKVQQYDIAVAIHNHGPTDPVYPTPDIIYEKIKSLDPRIGLCIDIGHTARVGVDPSEAAQRCADRLLDFHIKDVNETTAKGHCVEAGRGVLDIPRFIRTLDELGYEGKISFEYEKDMNAPLPGLAESAGYYRGVMASV